MYSRTEQHGPDTSSRFTTRITGVAMGLLIIVLAVHLMEQFDAVLQQLLIAALIGYLILPAHHWLVRHRIPRLLASILLMALFMGASYGLGQMIYQSLYQLAFDLPRYQVNFYELMRKTAERLPGVDRELLQELLIGQSISMENTIGMVRTALGSFFNFFTELTVVLIYLVFLLAEQGSFERRITMAFEPARARRIMAIVHNINRSIVQYIAVKTLMSIITGLMTFGVLMSFGVKYASLWAIVAFLLNYIPYLGSVVATALPALMSLLDSANPWRAVLVLLTLGLIHNGIGYFVEPEIAGHRLNLSPLVILLALAFGAAIWGVVGMILAVPLVVVIKAVLENIGETRPIATMMSNV